MVSETPFLSCIKAVFVKQNLRWDYMPQLLECSFYLCSFKLFLAQFQIHISVIEVYQLMYSNKLLVQEYFNLEPELNQVIKEPLDLLAPPI